MIRYALALLLLFAGAPAGAGDGTSPAGSPDAAKVTTLVSSITVAVDQGAYDLAQAAFAPEVVIDYTSLWGGAPSVLTPEALVTSWQGIVPGFDATWHELGPVTVAIDGDRATATAPIDARHWIGDRLWRPIGHYDWDLARVDGAWKVTRMVFRMTEEIGDRALASEAMDRVAGK